MKNWIVITISLISLLACSNVCIGADSLDIRKTHLLNPNMLELKIDLDSIQSSVQQTRKLSSRDRAKLATIKNNVDSQRKIENNTNLVPIYYKLGNIYKTAGMKDEAITCFRTITKYYPTSPLAKKSKVVLRDYGEAVKDAYGHTYVLPSKEDLGGN